MSGANEARQASGFEAVFEDAPVAIWYEDFSAVKKYLDELRARGVHDLIAEFERSPETLFECLRRIRVCHVNRLAREFYGAENPDQVADSLPSLFDEAALATLRQELSAFFSGAHSFTADIEAATFQGGRRLVQMNVSILPAERDDWSRVVVAFTDLTERRELERSLERANEALRRSNEELEAFAYAAAHELKEPLRTVSMFARILQRADIGKFDDAAGNAVEHILSETERMRELIVDLLGFARALENGPPNRAVATDTRSVVDAALTALGASAEASGAEVVIGDLPPVSMDASQLRHVLQNLLSNALKYAGSGLAPTVRISGEEVDGETRICVADNGPGIPARYQEEIFALFKRLHGREIPGTGIGLALCKRIVEHNGGRVWVDSEEGRGARFYFSIPRS